MIVCKFGGTSVSTTDRMKQVATLIAESTPKIVVVSAMADTTNCLEKIAANLFSHDIEQARENIVRLEFKFVDFANKLLQDHAIRQEAIDYLLDNFQQLYRFTKNSFTAAGEKEVLAQGELVCTALMSFYLRERNIPNVLLSALEFMRTDPDGVPDLGYIENKLQEQLARHPDINLFITQGCICKNAYNETDNLNQGGSDYTASLVGAAIHADEIQIRTDMNGMCNNAPCEVSGAHPVKRLSFEEAEQLAFYGAGILPPYCMTPARERNIPVRLFDSMEPADEGTLISDWQDEGVIKAVTARDHVVYIKFKTNRQLCSYLFISKIFDTFSEYKVPMCLSVSSNQDVSVAVDMNEHLSGIISDLLPYANTLVEDHMSIISVVGNMRWQYTGFEAKIMEAIKDIPIRMISYGSNNSDISFVVKTENRKKTLQSLNDKLFQL